MLAELLGSLIDALIGVFLGRLSGPGKRRAAAARRLVKYENLENVMVPFYLRGEDLGMRIEYFEMGLLKGYTKPRFGWWDEVLLGDFGSFLRTLEHLKIGPDGTVDGICRAKDGRPVLVSVQGADLEILNRYFAVQRRESKSLDEWFWR